MTNNFSYLPLCQVKPISHNSYQLSVNLSSRNECWAILNKSWWQHPTKQQLYGHQPPITKTIKIRQTRYAGHCWRSKDELVSAVLLWTPSHGRPKVWRPVRTYIQQLYADTGCNPEDLPKAMDDRKVWQERVRNICADRVTWWWWWWWWWWWNKTLKRVILTFNFLWLLLIKLWNFLQFSKYSMKIFNFHAVNIALINKWSLNIIKVYPGNLFVEVLSKSDYEMSYGYRCWKWNRRREFKHLTRLLAFHFALMLMGKAWIHLSSAMGKE